MGLPTVNLQPSDGALLPAVGVYAALAQLEDGRLLPGVTNVGLRPTFRTGGGPTVETNILGFGFGCVGISGESRNLKTAPC